MKTKAPFFIGLGVIAGFVIAKLTSGPATGVQGILPSIHFSLFDLGIHLHHWLWAGTGALTMLVMNKKKKLSFSTSWSYVVLGILFGLALQGLHYEDWDRVFYLH